MGLSTYPPIVHDAGGVCDDYELPVCAYERPYVESREDPPVHHLAVDRSENLALLALPLEVEYYGSRFLFF